MDSWWDAFCEAGGLDDLQTWLGGVDAPSRVRLRQRVAECNYEHILDCGAGLGLDYIQMKNLSHPIVWKGIEPSKLMREAAQSVVRNAFKLEESIPIKNGSIQDIPHPADGFDLVYARHIFEHLPRIERALNEMIKVATLEVIVVFFMRPGKETYLTRERDGLWQNWWGREDIEKILLANPKVEVWFWETLGSECLLHAYLKNSIEVDPAKVAERNERVSE
jgi:ubiquinone/menaquinone biosynthesis C-methylase UbiE